jgi:hypothetical protein
MAIVQVSFYGDMLNVTDKAVKHIRYGLFRNLTDEEKEDFIVKVKEIWHPITQDYLLTTGHGVE